MEHLFLFGNRLGGVSNGSIRTWVLGFGNHLKWKNRRKNERTIRDGICLLFYLFLFLWHRLSTFHLRNKISSISLWFRIDLYPTNRGTIDRGYKDRQTARDPSHTGQISSQILSPWLGDIVDSGLGLSYRHAIDYIGWRADMTTLCQRRLYPPVRD